MYSTYEADGFGGAECEAEPTDRKKVVILGGGPNRIGQGIEFDYCCVHAAYALREAGYETIMVNCNPETVSTDYDTSDRLYFEPLTAEDVLELVRVEQSKGEVLGVIVQFGGQTPLKLARALEAAGMPILGTSPTRSTWPRTASGSSSCCTSSGCSSRPTAWRAAWRRRRPWRTRSAIPVLIRPSYVLGGRAMEIVHDDGRAGALHGRGACKVSGKNPVLIDSYLEDAIEVDVDAVCDGDDVYVAGIMEHIEEAGIHSGDCACSLPPYSLASAWSPRSRARPSCWPRRWRSSG